MHSSYSLLDALPKVEDIVEKIHSMGQKGFALSEHGNAFSAVKGFKKAQEKGLKFVYASELYLYNEGEETNRRYYHILVLAKNETGRLNLNKLISLSYKKEHMYYKPRIPFSKLKEHGEGLIILSACMASEIQRLIWEEIGPDKKEGSIEKAKEVAKRYKGIWGDDYYLEIQSHDVPEQKAINRVVVDIAKELGIQWVATADAHFVNEDDMELHGIFIEINRNGKEPGETYRDCYIMNENEVRQKLATTLSDEEIEIAVENTGIIVDKCTAKIPLSPPIIPHVKIPEEYSNEDEYLKALCNEGWIKRGINKLPKEERAKYKERLLYEFDAVSRMKFSGYYLLVYSYVNTVERVGPGRGSGAGSLIGYLLEITDIDPLKYGLFFERFIETSQLDALESGALKAEDLKCPDYDVDFGCDDREKVIKFIIDTYGENKVASIGIIQTMWNKSAIKDVGRVLGVPFEITNELTKLLEEYGIEKDADLDSVADEFPSIKQYQEKYPKMFDYASKISGLPRQFGKHPCGRCIMTDDVINYTAVQEIDGEPVMQTDMKDAELIGAVKIDALGLRTLDIIFDVLQMLNKNYDYVSPQNINMNDQKVYQEIFQSGNTLGVFQMESEGITAVLKKMIPTNIDDIAAVNALFRPGPMQYIDNYINRKHGIERVEYLHDDLKEIFGSTYGNCVFQEQLISVGKLAGMRNPDLLRKATGKKDAKLMAKAEPELREGLYKRGWTVEQVDKLWSDMLRYSQYSFNRSHSYSYAILSFITAFLKTYHPVEFMTAMFNSYEGKHDEMEKCFHECRRINIQFLPPDWRNTSPLCKVIDGKILYGTSLIKYCNRQISEDLQKLSTNQYPNFTSFLKNLRENTSLNSRQIGILINLNYFSEFGNNKKLFQIYEKFEERFKVTHKDKTKLQRIAEILEYEESLSNDTYKPQEQAKLEQEFYGFIKSTYPDIKPCYVMALEIDTKYTPKIKCYQFNTGNELLCKVKKNLFMDEKGRQRFDVNDIINVKKHSYRNKRKLVNGEWTETNEQELYIDDFLLVKSNNERGV